MSYTPKLTEDTPNLTDEDRAGVEKVLADEQDEIAEDIAEAWKEQIEKRAEERVKPLRVLVCGSRTWTDETPIRRALALLAPGSVVIHGGAQGADTIADRVARSLGLEVQVFPVSSAEWRKMGPRAGPLRNARMLREGQPDWVYAFSLGTRGTRDMVAQAQAAGIPTTEFCPGEHDEGSAAQ